MLPGVRATAFAAALAALASTTAAGEPPIAPLEPVGRPVTQENGDPCRFFRGQAAAKGLADFTREMLWACEEISRRRAARIPLGDRLEAAADRLDAYRDAIIAAGSEAFARKGRPGLTPRSFGLSDDEKLAIADATGALLALEAIRLDF